MLNTASYSMPPLLLGPSHFPQQDAIHKDVGNG
jgi:hypothetical protein